MMSILDMAIVVIPLFLFVAFAVRPRRLKLDQVPLIESEEPESPKQDSSVSKATHS